MNPLLRRPRWLLAHLTVLAVLVTFASLGMWQLRRLDEKRAANARIEARLSVPTQPIGELAPGLPETDVVADEWSFRRVTVTGVFDPSGEVLLLSRSHRSIAGYHVVTPLRTDAGYLVLVNRGWVPLEMSRAPVTRAPPPSGRVTATGVLFPSQEAGRFGPKIPPAGTVRQLFRIEIPRLRQQLGEPVFPLWLMLQSQRPPQPQRHPFPAALPSLEDGPHLSYAIQWFCFAVAALGTYLAVLRKRVGDAARRRDAARELETIA